VECSVSEQTFISAKWLISCGEVAGILRSGQEEPTTMIISSSTEHEKEDLSKLCREWYGNACLLKEKDHANLKLILTIL